MRRIQFLLSAGLLAAASLLSGGVAYAADATQPVARPATLNIAAQPLRDALAALGKQTGLQVIYPAAEVTENLIAPRVSGRFTPREALSLLLGDSGLYYEFLNARTVAIRALKTEAGRKVSGAASLGAGGVRLADAGRAVDGAAASDDGVEEMLVEGERDKPEPFTTNMDITRSIDDTQPYYIFDSKTIERSGAADIEDFLKQRLTMNTVAQTNGQKSGPNELGNTSEINLRGIGADKTLILINGRRMPGVTPLQGNSPDRQPDLNGIALSAIDRIEVLPSSASGIYGGSAMGGVVNVILKKDYSGGQLAANYDAIWGTSSSKRTVSASYGWALEGGKAHLSVNASWSDGNPFLLQDRVSVYQANVATLLANYPDFLFYGPPWLGSLTNIANVFTPVPAGTPGCITLPPALAARYGITDDNPCALQDGPLQLKNGVSLGSNVTYVPAGTSSATTGADLADGLVVNAGQWNLDFPRSTQSPTGLLRPLSATPEARSLMLNFSRQMSPNLQLFADVSVAQNRSRSIFNPVDSSYYINADAPANPFTSMVRVQIPDVSQFPITTRSQNRTATLGALAQLSWGWTVNLDYTWSENRFDYFHYLVDDSLANELGESGGALNVFVDTLKYPLNFQQYIVPQSYQGSNRLYDLAARGSGPLPSLPWGRPDLAFGLERRIAKTPERIQKVDYPITVEKSYQGKNYQRESTTDSVYLEAALPLSKSAWLPLLYRLDLQLSGRSERYTIDACTWSELTFYNQTPPVISYSGTTLNGQPYHSRASHASNNYTVGLKYQPMEELTVRISRATAFMPPSQDQLLKDPQTYFEKNNRLSTRVVDPKSGSTARTYVDTLSGGNPDLKPQNSRSLNAGMIWRPHWRSLEGLRLNVEYYRIEQFDAIGSLSAQTIVDQESAYSDRVVRDSSGTITLVDISKLNLYRRETEGWDLVVDHSLSTEVGRFDLNVVGSVILHLKDQYAQTLPEVEAAGYPNEGGAGKYKGNATLSWEWRSWTVGWTARYFSSYKQYGAAGGPASTRYAKGGVWSADTAIMPQGGDTIPAQIYCDLFLGRTFNAGASSRLMRGLTVQFGMRNVFAKVPPLDAYYYNNFYLSPYGDIRLRSYWLNLTKAFQ